MRRAALTILVGLCIGCTSHTASSSRDGSTSATETQNDPSSEFCNHPAGPANKSPLSSLLALTATSNASGPIQFDCDGGKGYSAVLAAFAAAKRETNGLPLLMNTMTSARRVQNGGPVDSDLKLLMKLENPQVSDTATS
jgi:hypothetical protein